MIPRRRQPCFVIFFTIHLLLASCLTIHIIAAKPTPIVPLRIVVFDAGSSGTRAHLFNLRASQESEEVMHQRVLNVNPGLSSFHDKPERAGPYLEPLIRSALEAIPKEERSHTYLFVLATAGMRTLTDAIQTSIYDSVFNYFHDTEAGQRALGNSKLERDYLGTITGQEEGFYGMLAVNFLMGRIEAIGQMDRQMRGIRIAATQRSQWPRFPLRAADGKHEFAPAFGAMDLGGQSTQILYDPLPPEGALEKPADIYAHSFLGLGLNALRIKYYNFIADQSLSAEQRVTQQQQRVAENTQSSEVPNSAAAATAAAGATSISLDASEVGGVADAFQRSVKSACFFPGLSYPHKDVALVGTGDGAQCRREIQHVLAKEMKASGCVRNKDEEVAGEHKRVADMLLGGGRGGLVSKIGGWQDGGSKVECTFDGERLPPMAGGQVVAMSAYYYAVSAVRNLFATFEVSVSVKHFVHNPLHVEKVQAVAASFHANWPHPNLHELRRAADVMCAFQWSPVHEHWSGKSRIAKLPLHCLELNVVIELLSFGFGVEEDGRKLMYAARIDGREAEWALGAFLVLNTMILNAEAGTGGGRSNGGSGGVSHALRGSSHVMNVLIERKRRVPLMRMLGSTWFWLMIGAVAAMCYKFRALVSRARVVIHARLRRRHRTSKRYHA